MEKIKLVPEFSTGQAHALTLMYIHKKLNNADVYFATNQLDNKVSRECMFRTSNKNVEIWNLQYGNVASPSDVKSEGESTTLSVSFQPHESLMFVFTENIQKTEIPYLLPQA